MATFQVPATLKSNKGFIRRVTLATAWGEGLDGYDLGVISVVLPLLSTELGISAIWAGLIGASTLIGIFFGGPVFGYLTDKFGRRRLFTIDIIAFIILGLLQVVVVTDWQLFVVRVLLGLAIGAEYAIGPPMLAEFSPSRGRGSRLTSLQVCWYAGYLLSVLVAYGMLALDVHWRWILATSAVPAIVTLVLRFGLPESPRWLMSRGRIEEARRIVVRYLGESFFDDEELHGESAEGADYRKLFAPGMRSRTTFVCVFWACLVAPYFAIFTFAPQVLSSLHLNDERAGTVAINGVAFLGALFGMAAIERIGRRKLLLVPFWIMAAVLIVVGIWSHAPTAVIVACFAVFAFLNAIGGDLTGVYPDEIFPTELRSSGVGFAAAASRVGAAIGTFLLPVGLITLGVGPCMLIAAALCVIGAVVSHIWAPETTRLSLTRTGRAPLPIPAADTVV